LLPHLPRLGGWDRIHSAKLLVKHHGDDAQIREILLGLLRDRSSYVREEALQLIGERQVTEKEIGVLEGLLSRKTTDLRRAVLTPTLKQAAGQALASAERLLAAKRPLQRQAGLDLLRGLREAGRRVEQCRALAGNYRTDHTPLSTEEQTLLAAILPEQA